MNNDSKPGTPKVPVMPKYCGYLCATRGHGSEQACFDADEALKARPSAILHALACHETHWAAWNKIRNAVRDMHIDLVTAIDDVNNLRFDPLTRTLVLACKSAEQRRVLQQPAVQTQLRVALALAQQRLDSVDSDLSEVRIVVVDPPPVAEGIVRALEQAEADLRKP
ncbi:MAG: hypothetical protein NTW87_05565 [Planctomycetota bacterium]|nr:hypothetical protein [Planctomycetota bacterium]